MAELKPRLIRVADFAAGSLEAEGDRLPPSKKAQADSLRRMATIMRESDNPRKVRVWEEQPQKSKGKVDFIRPDPASHD